MLNKYIFSTLKSETAFTYNNIEHIKVSNDTNKINAFSQKDGAVIVPLDSNVYVEEPEVIYWVLDNKVEDNKVEDKINKVEDKDEIDPHETV
jgi:hypothetical protein